MGANPHSGAAHPGQQDGHDLIDRASGLVSLMMLSRLVFFWKRYR